MSTSGDVTCVTLNSSIHAKAFVPSLVRATTLVGKY